MPKAYREPAGQVRWGAAHRDTGRRGAQAARPVYRTGVAWQNTGYNQPPQVGYHLGTKQTGDG
ncbi:hypothetical protein ACF1G0_01815 [Streptomyces sp. NPDC013953]|uniref:rhamnogalacturonan lyase family protein n=1 Tax=Streptomyces sp. NPDC013953 TaxID=3364868 RepID=UPI0037011B9C